jgi:hypothetical protein
MHGIQAEWLIMPGVKGLHRQAAQHFEAGLEGFIPHDYGITCPIYLAKSGSKSSELHLYFIYPILF